MRRNTIGTSGRWDSRSTASGLASDSGCLRRSSTEPRHDGYLARREPNVMRVVCWSAAMADTILDGRGEPTPGRRPLDGTDLEIAYSLLGDDLVLRVNKAGVQVFGVVLVNARKPLTTQQLLELKTEKSDLVVSVGPHGDTVANVGFALGRMASKLIKSTRAKVGKT